MPTVSWETATWKRPRAAGWTIPSADRVARSSSLSLRPVRLASSVRVISTGISDCQGASIVRCSAMSSGVASAGIPATYFSIAARVNPWLCSSRTSSRRATWSGV